ncbi:UNVERIFIED_CONTAM: putative RING-H2 finger protein ATL21A [Sesamum radiatum]|uniref:RING-H2 finger protein ATL21A n=1 Tax=Sesamum radiatum TaxID=300843 RepID=A0AAW2VAI0_SESRA
MGVLKIISFALLLIQEIHAGNDCPSQSCGDNPFVVRFPFWLEGQQLQNCGYPGFDLSCTSQEPQVVVLNLPHSGDFWVRNINYLMQEIQLYDPNGCLPRRLLSLNLSSSPFMAGYSQNFTFLSCPPDSVRTRLAIIDCLSNSTVSVLATSSMNLARAMNMCSIVVTLPIPVSWPQDEDWLSSNLDEDLRLTWNVPSCGGCEARGGVCGFENSTSDQILCLTNPESGKSLGLQVFKIVSLSIVIPAVACLICIASFTCMVRRRSVQNSATAAVGPPPPHAEIAGLDELTIESYTKVVLGESRRLPGPNGATCPICLVDYHPNDTLSGQISKTILNIPYSGDFWVRDINYLLQEIQLYDPNGCLPSRLLSLNLSSSPFMAAYYKNFTFLSCPAEIVRNQLTTIHCLSNSTTSVLATSSINLAKAMNNCSIIVTLPIPLSQPVQDDQWLSSNLTADLRLTWDVPSCEDCKAKGGICGIDNSNSKQILCYDNPRTVKAGPLVLLIVAITLASPAITCSAGLLFYICMESRRLRRQSANRAAQNSTIAPAQPSTSPAAGLDDSSIETYRKIVLGESRRLPGPNGVMCPICLADYHPNDTIRCIPECEHCYHSDCIDEWLRMQNTCPVCRNSPSPNCGST